MYIIFILHYIYILFFINFINKINILNDINIKILIRNIVLLFGKLNYKIVKEIYIKLGPRWRFSGI